MQTDIEIKNFDGILKNSKAANAALAPQKRQCELGRYYPAESVVEVATVPSRGDVVCNRAGARRQRHSKINIFCRKRMCRVF